MPLAVGKRKYAAKTATMGPNWEDMKSTMKAHWPAAMADLAREAGKTRVKSARETAYKSGVDVISAADFTAAVRGKEDKWYDNGMEKPHSVELRGEDVRVATHLSSSL